MDKTITTALLIVISIIMAIMLFNIAYPAVIQGGQAITSMAARAEDQMRSQISIIHAAGELDADQNWTDSNGSATFDVFAWVKNLGTTRILGLERIDVFFGPEGNFTRIPYGSDSGSPYWTYQIENDTQMTPSATVRLTITYGSPLPAGRYFLRVTLPNGVTDDTVLGL